jgi:glycosyltransferase involved in cell wall biosynthesis
MITIFTPSFADEANTNAQNLTVKEVVSRLPPDRFRVLMLGDGPPDPRIAARPNTIILRSSRRGNTVRWLSRILLSSIHIYFFPREGPLDKFFLSLRHTLRLPISLVTYIVMALDGFEPSPIMQRSIREADSVVGNSRYVSQTIADKFGRSAAATIYDGMNRELFHPPAELRRTASKLTVLYAGSLQARKKVNVVIREAAKWPEVEFRIAGKGEEESSCRSLITELGCRNVNFLGHVSQLQLAQEMRNADVFLFPSVLEGHPQVLGQAASCGLPVVAMDNYRPDYVINGETGYLVKSENEISEKLALLLSDRDLRHGMSAKAIRHAAQFNWDAITRDWEKVFEETLRRRESK